MAIPTTLRESLPLRIECDPSSGLPLLREAPGIFDLVLAYLALPYSVAEFGCGKKASLILDYLARLGLPPHALGRGLIMERDMSPDTLAETDPSKRPHALIARNPLADLGNFRDPKIAAMLAEACPGARVENGSLRAGPYRLSQTPEIQFVIARSHVFAEMIFWDDDDGRVARRVIDPALKRDRPIGVDELRGLLDAPEALAFRAPPLERFHLEPELLTERQRGEIDRRLEDGPSLAELDAEEHAALVRALTGAERGSIGDPLTWTYANNIQSEKLVGEPEDPEDFRQHDSDQLRATERPGNLRRLTRDLLRERERLGPQTPALLAAIDESVNDSNLRQILAEDAAWSKQHLQILADVATTLGYAKTLDYAAGRLAAGHRLADCLDDPACTLAMRGIGVRLRRRLDLAADVSRPDHGENPKRTETPIDARALGPGFIGATIETIRQMNAAGLRVTLDRVGNLHGLLPPPTGSGAPARPARLAHVSHIDTVLDAGKFDGRLGVLSGIETAHFLRDLARYHDLPLPGGADPATVFQVTAFVGEEMTFTGEGVSMPGSAAVAGRADCARVHRMTNADGEHYRDRLVEMLRQLRDAKAEGKIEFTNDFDAADDDPEALLEACAEPTDFFTPHTFERHIEQGPILDRAGVPLVLVGTIMGIRQEDFRLTGDRAEEAGVRLIGRLRDLARELESDDAPLRATVGIFEGHPDDDDALSREDLGFALGCRLVGELNHAGSTPNVDRGDPGVALSRLADLFRERIEADHPHLVDRALIGNVYLEPGTNRNVIPGTAGISFGLPDDPSLSAEWLADLRGRLESAVTHRLSRPISEGGENVALQQSDPLSFVRVSRRVRLSLDLRFASEDQCQAFLDRLDRICDDVCRTFHVRLNREPQQYLRPQRLEKTGQTLLIERSFGGSHTPRETELLGDMIRAGVLQIDVSMHALGEDLAAPGFNLFRTVESRIPESWRGRLARFTSGALHDTCNIAARALDDSR